MNAAVNEGAATTMAKAMVHLFQQMRRTWDDTPEKEQEQVIFHIRQACESATRKLATVIAAGNRPAIAANVEQVTFKDGVKCVLTLDKTQAGVHALADATGSAAMIVLASAQEYLEGMETVTPDPDQEDMFRDGEQQPTEGGESWAEFAEANGFDADEPRRSMGSITHELLARVFVPGLSVETCEAWSEPQCVVASEWAIAYADGKDTPARPHWLPQPQPPNGHVEGDDEGDSEGGEA